MQPVPKLAFDSVLRLRTHLHGQVGDKGQWTTMYARLTGAGDDHVPPSAEKTMRGAYEKFVRFKTPAANSSLLLPLTYARTPGMTGGLRFGHLNRSTESQVLAPVRKEPRGRGISKSGAGNGDPTNDA